MVFITNYLSACAENGIAPTALLRNLGISSSLLAKWKKGVEPSNATKLKIANHFNVSVAELENGKKEKPTTKSDELIEREERFKAIMLLLPDDRKEMVEAFAARLLSMQ